MIKNKRHRRLDKYICVFGSAFEHNSKKKTFLRQLQNSYYGPDIIQTHYCYYVHEIISLLLCENNVHAFSIYIWDYMLLEFALRIFNKGEKMKQIWQNLDNYWI